MGIVPENTSPRIGWYRAHLAAWAEHAGEIGVSEEQVALLDEKIAAAAEKFKQQRMARDAARSATQSLHQAMEELSVLGSNMIQAIKATAAVQGRGVYSKALIPPPADPSPIGAPGMPMSFKATLLPVGEIDLRWKCQNPKGSEGTMYEIQRQVGDDEPFVFIGVVGKKKFRDESVPAGAPRVTYCITAVRSTRRGVPNFFMVRLGVNGRRQKVVPCAA